MGPASYQFGFAPRDGQPLHPALWRGCVGAWAPCLGPTGTTIRDWSGYGNHGTLTNMTLSSAWQQSGGRYSTLFAGTTQHIDTGNSSLFDFASGDFSASLWLKITTADRGVLGTLNSTPRGWGLYVWSTSPYVNWFAYGASSTNDNRKGTSDLRDSRWHMIAANYSRVTGITTYVDGIEVGNASNAGYGDLSSTQTLQLGRYPAASSFAGNLDDVRVYNRLLSGWEIKLLATRRGIAYEMASRRRSSVQVVTGNRRRRLLIGAH
jgi:hypothetical protein